MKGAEVHMSRQRDLRLCKYGISKYRYRELFNFCLQYPEWKFFLQNQTDNLKAANISGEPDGGLERETVGHKQYIYIDTAARTNRSTVLSNPEEDLAIKRAELSEYCSAIEECAKEAGPGIGKWLLFAVTHEAITYTELRMQHSIPCGHRYFEECRRKFFFILSKKEGRVRNTVKV